MLTRPRGVNQRHRTRTPDNRKPPIGADMGGCSGIDAVCDRLIEFRLGWSASVALVVFVVVGQRCCDRGHPKRDRQPIYDQYQSPLCRFSISCLTISVPAIPVAVYRHPEIAERSWAVVP